MSRRSYKKVPVPGVMEVDVAFARAAKHVKDGQFEEARALKPYMKPTDAGLIEQRIAKAMLEPRATKRE